MRILKLIAIALISLPTMCFAGELTKGATVLEVANHATGNGKYFAVKVDSGVGPCNGWIYFQEDGAASLATYNQAFSIALTALTADKKVRIHNYLSDSCVGASFIAISR